MIRDAIPNAARDAVRLVRGSHIVTRRLYDHDKCYFFQGTDGRIIFAIPYEDDFTLIGTTDAEQPDIASRPVCTEAEKEYLLDFASRYFAEPVTEDLVVWSYSGVRPLYDDNSSSATAATRDYVLRLDDAPGAPLLNVFGGKITTYRRLAESAVAKLSDQFPGLKPAWTAGVPLAGGDFSIVDRDSMTARLKADFPFLSDSWASRLIRSYGTEARTLLQDARAKEDLGTDFGGTLTEREVTWLCEKEFAATADDLLWRRSKLGLRLTAAQAAALEAWMAQRPG